MLDVVKMPTTSTHRLAPTVVVLEPACAIDQAELDLHLTDLTANPFTDATGG